MYNFTSIDVKTVLTLQLTANWSGLGRLLRTCCLSSATVVCRATRRSSSGSRTLGEITLSRTVPAMATRDT